MADAYEHIESRQGTRSGLFGGRNATTRWVVTCDAESDDPRAVLAEDFCPVGTPHPLDDSVVAQEYTLDGFIDGLRHFVMVDYGPVLLIPGLEWELQLDTALETELVEFADVVDAAGNVVASDVPVGPHIYKPVTKDEDGALIYPDDANLGVGTFYTVTASGEKVTLVQIGDDYARRVKGIERTRDVSQFVLSTRSTTLTEAQILVAESFNNTVNSRPFFGRTPGTVKFVAPQITQRVASDAVVLGQPATGVVFDVRLPFLVDKRGHQPKIQLDMYIDQATGGETPVFHATSNDKRTTKYWPYGTSDFASLLKIFGLATIRSTGK